MHCKHHLQKKISVDFSQCYLLEIMSIIKKWPLIQMFSARPVFVWNKELLFILVYYVRI